MLNDGANWTIISTDKVNLDEERQIDVVDDQRCTSKVFNYKYVDMLSLIKHGFLIG